MSLIFSTMYFEVAFSVLKTCPPTWWSVRPGAAAHFRWSGHAGASIGSQTFLEGHNFQTQADVENIGKLYRLLRVSKCIKAYLKSLPCAPYYFHKIAGNAGNAETLSSATSIVLVGWPMILWIVFVPKWSTSLSAQVELKHWSVAAHPGPPRNGLDHVWTHKLDSSWMVGCSRWPNFWVHW